MGLGTGKLARANRVFDFAAPVTDMRGVRALVLVGGKPEAERRFRDFPLAMFDVLGRSVLLRTLDRIRACGIAETVVLGDTAPLPSHSAAQGCTFSVVESEKFWPEALQQFRKLSRQSECILVMRLGAWAELDYPAMVAEHRRQGSAILRACTAQGEALDCFVISSSGQTESAALLRGELNDERIPVSEYKSSCYVNMLSDVASLRTLTLDAFAGETDFPPCGREIRPGVWVGKGARIHRDARVVAPAFIGEHCKVRDASVVTRGSSLERHTEVDCASMIDNSTVLAYTRVGAGIELERAVAGMNQVHSLLRNVTVKIDDPHLIGDTTTRISAQVFSGVNWAVNFLPNIFWKLFFEQQAEQKTELNSDLLEPHATALEEAPLAPATAESKTETYREMAVRRYGNE